MKILVVDDSGTMRRLLRIILEELGYHDIQECGNVPEAKDALEKETFGLIFSDWNMPGESGLDLLRFVRSNSVLIKIPFIIITSDSNKNHVIEALKQGVQAYVFKPLKKDVIFQKLKDLAKSSSIQPPIMVNIASKPAELQQKVSHKLS
jgi:two-component system chemotaxis response regulator CheY